MTWQAPYWWESTQQARDDAGKDFDRTVAVDHPTDEVPFQKTAASRCPQCGEPQLNLVYDPAVNWQPQFACSACGFKHYVTGEDRAIGTPYTDAERNQMWADVVKSPNRDPMFLDPENWSNFGAPHQGRASMVWDDQGNIQPTYQLQPGETAYISQNPRSPWLTRPDTGERVSGLPGTSLMQHVMTTMGHQDPREVWAQDYEVGKDEAPPGTIAKVAAWGDWEDEVRGWYDPNAVKPFAQHSPEVQAALQRYEEDAALDAGEWDGEDEAGRPVIPAEQPYGASQVPMADFTRVLLNRLNAEGDNWPDWNTYHRDYASHPDMPDHGASRWPVLSSPEVVVDDGYHRLHDYYRKGDQSVPIAWDGS